METLKSMIDFVISQWDKDISREEFAQLTIKYATFLKQPLTLGMFVPTDEDGNVLEGKPLSPAPDSEWLRWENERPEFFEAKERVLFEGFVDLYSDSENSFEIQYLTPEHEEFITILKGGTVESLLQIDFEFELTETANQKINGNTF